MNSSFVHSRLKKNATNSRIEDECLDNFCIGDPGLNAYFLYVDAKFLIIVLLFQIPVQPYESERSHDDVGQKGRPKDPAQIPVNRCQPGQRNIEPKHPKSSQSR